MQIRDAVEADAEAIAAMSDAPVDVVRNLVHDRTVRVAAADNARAADPNVDAGGAGASLLGFVSFDAAESTVHVTQFGGQRDACIELLGEPVRFATAEGMSVELLIEAGNDESSTVATDAGFTKVGTGPQFNNAETVRYRLEPEG